MLAAENPGSEWGLAGVALEFAFESVAVVVDAERDAAVGVGVVVVAAAAVGKGVAFLVAFPRSAEVSKSLNYPLLADPSVSIRKS